MAEIVINVELITTIYAYYYVLFKDKRLLLFLYFCNLIVSKYI